MALPEIRPGSGADGFEHLYGMVDTFLNDMIQPYTIGDLIKDNNITKLSDFTQDSFLDSWKEWAPPFYGFIACVLVGLTFVGVFLIVTIVRFCTLCVCLVKPCCCKQGDEMYVKSTKVKNFICAPLLFGISCLMFAAVVCAYMNNVFVKNEMSSANSGVFGDVINGLDNIEHYLDDSMDDINKTILSDMTKTTDDVFAMLHEIPTKSIEYLGNETGMSLALIDLAEFTYILEPLAYSLQEMENTTYELQNSTGLLAEQLNVANASISNLMLECLGDTGLNNATLAICKQVLDDSKFLTTNLDYHHLGSDVGNASDVTSFAIDKGFLDLVNETIYIFRNLTHYVSGVTEDQIDQIEKDIREFENNIQIEFYNISQWVDAIPFDEAKEKVENFVLDTGQYAVDIWFYTVIFITTLCLAIPFCFLIGLMFGECCPFRSKVKTSKCSSIHGSRMLCAGVGFSYAFLWVFMLFTTAAFIAGGGLEVMLCRHLVTYDESMQALENITKNEYNVQYNATVRGILDDCSANMTIYTALNFDENGFNITEIVDLEQYGIYDIINDIKDISINLPDLDIVSPKLFASLVALGYAYNKINFDLYKFEIAKPVTETDLPEMASDLEQIAADPNMDKVMNILLIRQANKLEDIQNTSVVHVEHQTNILDVFLRVSEALLESQNISILLESIINSQIMVNTNGSSMVDAVIEDTMDTVLTELENFSSDIDKSIRFGIGNCRVLYDTCVEVVYGPCVYFLNPFNALWFCYGWFISFGVFAMIAACVQRTVFSKYKPAEGESYRRPIKKQSLVSNASEKGPHDWTELRVRMSTVISTQDPINAGYESISKLRRSLSTKLNQPIEFDNPVYSTETIFEKDSISPFKPINGIPVLPFDDKPAIYEVFFGPDALSKNYKSNEFESKLDYVQEFEDCYY